MTCRCVKNSATIVTTTADQQAAHDAARHVAATISQFGSGETSSSSMCLPNFAPKNDDTTLRTSS